MKRTGVALMAALLAIPTMATTATAATSQHHMTTKQFYLNGKLVISPAGFVANDGGTQTTYMPIWYLEQVLKQLGITDSWDGHSWKLTLPQGSNPDLSNISVGKGNASIYINGTLVSRPNSIVDVDPSSRNATTFMPLWYLEQVLHRIGVTDSWNGTTWTLTGTPGIPADAATKEQVVSTFETALGVSENQLKVPSNVSAAFTLADVDRMYWDYIGIPDSNASYQPGGSPSGWGGYIGLNRGLSAGYVTFKQLAQLSANLTALKDGYYKDSSGTYHLVITPRDEYENFFKSSSWQGKPYYPTTSAVQQAITKAYGFMDSVTVKVEGNYMIATLPTYSMGSEWYVQAGAVDSTYKTQTLVSLDGGKTWKSWINYASDNADYGGVNAAPATVLVKVPLNTGVALSFHQFVPSFGGTGIDAVRVTYTGGALQVVRVY